MTLPTFPATSLALRGARFALWSRHVAASRRPIFVGPWTSEVGFEALYWLPFLAAWRHRYGIDKGRIVAIGRGGSGVWYDAGAVGDVYDHVSPKDLRTHTWSRAKATGSVKQRAGLTAWDRHVCGLVASSLGIPRYHVLHPSWMYTLLAPFWEERRTAIYLQSLTRHARIAPPPLPPGMVLPERFAVARFYARPTFPPNEDIILWAQDLAARLGQQQPVILLHSGGHYDDHVDLLKPDLPHNVHALPVLPATENLAILSAVLGRASAFVGTYGGFAQLALMMGIPSWSFYGEWHSTAFAHLCISHTLGIASNVPFVVTRPTDAGLVERLLAPRSHQAALPLNPEAVLP